MPETKSQTTPNGVEIILGANHQYRIVGDPNIPKGRIPGVTSVIRESSGSSLEPLMRWSRNLIYETARDHFINMPYLGYSDWDEYVSNTMDLARQEPDLRRDLGGAKGTAVHNAIEEGRPDYPEAVAALSFLSENNLHTISTEFYVYSAKHVYAGSIDLLAQPLEDDRVLILDWKTGYVDDGCALQIGAYALAFGEMYPDLKIDGGIVQLDVSDENSPRYNYFPVNIGYAQEQFLIARQLYASRREKDDAGKSRKLWT